jgi:uncharacterized protein YutE (UPF0331/DUF86 family)
MVIRAEVLRERIAVLREAVARLRRLREEDLDDPVIEWAVERGLQVAAEAVFDIGNHVLAGGFSSRAPDYASVPGLLARHGVLSEDLEARLKGLAGFRNILVHDYVRVDPARVRQLLATRLGDFEAFAGAIEAWLDRQRP